MTPADERAAYIRDVLAAAPPIRDEQLHQLRTALAAGSASSHRDLPATPGRAKAPAAAHLRRPHARSVERTLEDEPKLGQRLTPPTHTADDAPRSPKRIRRAGRVS